MFRGESMEILNLSGLPFSTILTSSNDEHLHSHEFYECFYIKEGSIYHKIHGEEFLMETGDAVIVAPFIPHEFKRIPGQTCFHRDNMISPALFEKCCNFVDKEILEKLNKEHFIQYKFSKSNMESFEENTSTYISSQNIEKMEKYNHCMVVNLLGPVIISCAEKNELNNEFMFRCNMILTACFAHFNAIDEVYDHLGYNKSYVSKKFKDNYGVTLTEKINELKINYSHYLLSAANYTIREICDKIGIESITHFHRLFKKYYGTTPHKAKRSIPNEF